MMHQLQARPDVLLLLRTTFLDSLREQPDPVLVIGRDEPSGREFLIYGRPDLECCIATGTSVEIPTIRVPILQETEELEMLLAVVAFVKGRHDYIAADDRQEARC